MSKTITSKIELNVELDANRVPEKLYWTAQDGGITNEEAKAMMLAVWDSRAQETLRIDLWTKEMEMDDMKRFYHQIFISMATSYQRATNEDEVADSIIEFAENFAHQAGIKSPK